MRFLRTSLLCALSALLFLSAASFAGADGPAVIRVGILTSTSDAPLWIADRNGYFKDEGLNVQFLTFNSGESARIDDVRSVAYCKEVSRAHREGTFDSNSIYMPAPAVVASYRGRPGLECGTLDAHELRDIERGGYDAAAQSDLDNLRWLPGPRDWWRLGFTESGDLAGFAGVGGAGGVCHRGRCPSCVVRPGRAARTGRASGQDSDGYLLAQAPMRSRRPVR